MSAATGVGAVISFRAGERGPMRVGDDGGGAPERDGRRYCFGLGDHRVDLSAGV